MIPKPLDQITDADIRSLLDTGREESTTFEYKSTLPGDSDSDKREFRHDVSAFANTQGGDIIFGVSTADDGTPTEVNGLKGFNSDRDVLRLLSILRANVEPPLQGIQHKEVPGFRDGPVIVVRIPRSWSAPHMVIRDESVRFYMRHVRGKYTMSYHEIRGSFLGSLEIPERARAWRKERIALIDGYRPALSLHPSSRLVLHILPLESFANLRNLEISKIEEQRKYFPPPGFSLARHRINAEGVFFSTSRNPTTGGLDGYTQVFRSGRIEAVSSGFVRSRPEGATISGYALDSQVVKSVESYFRGLSALGVSPPVLLSLSVHGVMGVKIVCDDDFTEDSIDQETVLVPDVVCESLDENVTALMMPFMDVVWNASGYPQSHSGIFNKYRVAE